MRRYPGLKKLGPARQRFSCSVLNTRKVVIHSKNDPNWVGQMEPSITLNFDTDCERGFSSRFQGNGTGVPAFLQIYDEFEAASSYWHSSMAQP